MSSPKEAHKRPAGVPASQSSDVDAPGRTVISLLTPSNSRSPEEVVQEHDPSTTSNDISQTASGADLQSPSSYQPEHTIFRGTKQPPPQIRLPQIKIFLADEDYFNSTNFKERLQQVEDYIEDLEQNVYDYDLQPVNEIKQMIDVHHDWIKNDQKIPQLSIDFIDDREPWKLKLAALSKDPETLQGKIHELADCWKHSIGVLNTGKYNHNGELPPGEPLCLALEPGERPEEPDPFEYSKRMRQYILAMDLLYSQARNRLMYDRRNDTSFVPPPRQWNAPYFPLSKSEVAQGKVERYKMLKKIFEELVNSHRVAPRTLLRDVLLEVNAAINDKKVVDLIIESDTDYSFLTDEDVETLVVLSQPSWPKNSGPVKHTDPEQQDALVEFFNDLHILIRDWAFLGLAGDEGRTPHEIKEFVNRLRLGRGENTLFARAEVDSFLAHLIATGHCRINDQGTIFRESPDTHAERKFIIADPDDPDLSNLLANKRVDAVGTIDQATAVENLHFFVKAARRLGHEISRLREWERARESHHGEQWEAIQLLRHVYMTTPNLYGRDKPHTVVEMAEPLSEAIDTSGMTNERAAQLLQNKVIQEQHENKGPREPDFAKLWAWAKPLSEARAGPKFFSLDRWPLELQKHEKQVEILATGPDMLPETPEIGDLSGRYPVLEDIANKEIPVKSKESRETFYPGECFFPFAETPFQEAYQAWQIEEQLKDVPEFQWTREQKAKAEKARQPDRFALPELDERVRLQIARVRQPTVEPPILTEEHVMETELELEDLIHGAKQTANGRKRKADKQRTRGRATRQRQDLT